MSPRWLTSWGSASPSSSRRREVARLLSCSVAGIEQPQQPSNPATMNWLASLPHQIPFRAASAARRIDNNTIEGTFLCTANETLAAEVMVAEAMAQLAGGLAFHDTHGPGFLTGI